MVCQAGSLLTHKKATCYASAILLANSTFLFVVLLQLSFGDYRLPSTVAKEGPEHVYSKSASEKHQEKMVLDVDAVVKPLMMKDLR